MLIVTALILIVACASCYIVLKTALLTETLQVRWVHHGGRVWLSGVLDLKDGDVGQRQYFPPTRLSLSRSNGVNIAFFDNLNSVPVGFNWFPRIWSYESWSFNSHQQQDEVSLLFSLPTVRLGTNSCTNRGEKFSND